MKVLKKFFTDILGWIIGIIGIISTIVCAFATGDSDFIIIYVVVFAMETILTIIAIFHICIKHSYQDQLQELKRTLKEKDETIDNLTSSNSAIKKKLEDKYGI